MYQPNEYGVPVQQRKRQGPPDFGPTDVSRGPPRLPPEDGPPGPEGGDNQRGMSNLTKAFVAGAFILGMR